MLSILTYPHPILDTLSKDVSFPLCNEDVRLIKDMWEVVKRDGVGLAAPQVGINKRICIIHLSTTERGKEAKDIVMINPKIVFESEMEVEMIEGCLSFPDEYWAIWRPANIMVEYYNENGKKQKLRARNWLARVIQHEIDHLDGKVFIKKGGRKIKEEDLKGEVIVD